MQYDDSFAHHKAIERSAYASPAARPKLEKSIAEGARVRQAEAWTVRSQELDKTHVVGEDIDRPRLNLSKYAFVEVLDLKRLATMLANTLTLSNPRVRD